jgi:hypothetical protein
MGCEKTVNFCGCGLAVLADSLPTSNPQNFDHPNFSNLEPNTSFCKRMAFVTLVHANEERQIPIRQAIIKCILFEQQPALTGAPYRLRSVVPVAIFRLFIAALEGNEIEITDANFIDLSQLSDEFGFADLRVSLNSFQFSRPWGMAMAETRARIDRLEAQAQQRDRDFAEFRGIVYYLGADIARLTAEIAALRPAVAAPDPTAQRLVDEVARLRMDFSSLENWIVPLTGRESRIITTFPTIFAEFQGHHFELLWRGTRDGFSPAAFHARCDGHANTLTIIEDTQGNIMGGFTPLTWESSPTLKRKADPSMRSFIFTLKNPHNVPARKFALRPEAKEHAIECETASGPRFWDIDIANNCNTKSASWTWFGKSNSTYINDSRMEGETFLTGAKHFRVKEIEVFEILP